MITLILVLLVLVLLVDYAGPRYPAINADVFVRTLLLVLIVVVLLRLVGVL